MEYIVVSILNIVCFVIGAIIGQKTSNKEKIITNPVKAMEHHLKANEVKIEEEKYKKILANIDSYNGTSEGQQDI